MNRRISVWRTVLLSGGLLAGPGCAPAERPGGPRLPLVVTTSMMVTDTLRAIAGGDAVVEAMMGPGVDPHLFKPGQEDVHRLQKAGLIFYSGLHLEGRMTEILERLARQGRRVHAFAEALDEAQVLRADGEPDPHIWGDAGLWAQAAARAGEKLAAFLPGKAEGIRARTAAAVRELTATHERLKAAAAALPAAQRVLVTSHDAFRYFGRAYGLEVIGVQGISTVSEGSMADMARIGDVIRQRGVKAVFVESSVSAATIERLSRDTGARIGGELFADALGRPGDIRMIGGRRVDTATVCGMLEANMDTIVNALK